MSNLRKLCFFFVAILLVSAGHAILPPNSEAQETESMATGTDSEPVAQYEYPLDKRKDPFVPFVREQATTADIDLNEIVEDDMVLTGMQLFEPGQLNLVALMKSGNQDIAMVEDFTGKGYVITKGTKIGRRGIVTDIVPNKVLIEETAVTRAGRKIVTETVMVLKKEGDE